jgi:Cutinase
VRIGWQRLGSTGLLSILMLQATLLAVTQNDQRPGVPVAATSPEPPCSNVLLIGLRGSDDSLDVDLGMGAPVRAVFDLVRDKGFKAYALPYDALRAFVTPPERMKIAIDNGVRMLVELVGRRSSRCPTEKIVVAGYSLGAELLGNALGNHDVGRISAAVLFADLWFNPKDPVAAGTFDPAYGGQSGFRPVYPSGLVGKTRSYCRRGDRICQSGLPNATKVEHGRYVPDQSCEAAKFICTRLAVSPPTCN